MAKPKLKTVSGKKVKKQNTFECLLREYINKIVDEIIKARIDELQQQRTPREE